MASLGSAERRAFALKINRYTLLANSFTCGMLLVMNVHRGAGGTLLVDFLRRFRVEQAATCWSNASRSTPSRKEAACRTLPLTLH
uniref:Uncharacterized protein n=1 Tax=Oryzias melastigma TaxID=30732 RepID=A0A3B3DZ94_ORYME